MLNFLIRRVSIAFLTLILITFVVYGLIRAMPGSPTDIQTAMMDPKVKSTKEYAEALRKKWGLDDPWHIGYAKWLAGTVQGDLGESYQVTGKPVIEVIGSKVPVTLALSGSALLLTYLLSIPMGLYATARRNTLDERALSVVLYMLYSIPSFVAAVFLQVLLAVRLGWLPLMGTVSVNYSELDTFRQTLDIVWHAILPIGCLTYTSLALYSRFVRSNMVEVMQQDYIRTARAKGVSSGKILVVHAFRNTLIPLITLMALSLPAILSGSVIIERIFNWQGIGWLLLESITTRDYAVLMGLVLMFSVLTLLGQLLADILYAVVDPRVSLE
jgi:peptide/nickel transport system permease protein